MKNILISIFTLSFILQSVFSDTLTVFPDGTGNWSTIQEAINASSNGDIIQLADGIFNGIGNRDLDTEGKAITIQSENAIPENCIIDCNGTFNLNLRRAFIITKGEDTTTIIRNLSIIHGSTMQT